MKWLLVVLAFGQPMQTGLIYDTLDECMKAEAAMQAEWSRFAAAMPHRYQEMPTTKDVIAKQMTRGTCIPHGGPAR